MQTSMEARIYIELTQSTVEITQLSEDNILIEDNHLFTRHLSLQNIAGILGVLFFIALQILRKDRGNDMHS